MIRVAVSRVPMFVVATTIWPGNWTSARQPPGVNEYASAAVRCLDGPWLGMHGLPDCTAAPSRPHGDYRQHMPVPGHVDSAARG
ncbi:MAG TPA: hypothetical protein VHA75_16020, partial [Rugosimonospora sp.]|nr:hypothetical protein [Rugosimonospora sp.]